MKIAQQNHRVVVGLSKPIVSFGVEYLPGTEAVTAADPSQPLRPALEFLQEQPIFG